jgi:RNA polymerase sigma-70 factor (ECF subfamily)
MDRDEILARLRERIVAFAASRISRDVAEDLAQEVLMVLHDKYPEVVQIEDLLPLSLQIMRFKMAGLRRKVQRRGESGQVSVDEIQLPDLGSSRKPMRGARRCCES